MRRIFVAFFVICSLVAVTLASAPWWINSERLRGRITATLEQVSGRKVSFQGDANVTLNPFFGIRLADLVIDNQTNLEEQAPLLRAENALISINPFSAVFGKVDIRNVELQRPRLTLSKTSDGYSNWQLQSSGNGEDASEVFAATDASVKIWVRDGAVDYKDEISGTTELVSNLAGEMVWPGNSKQFSFQGNGIWRNESVELGLDISDLVGLSKGDVVDLSIAFSSEPLVFSFDGSANLQAGIFANGSLDANSPSISRLNDLFNLGLETTNIIGDWGAKGRLELKPGTLLLGDASIIANNTPASGVVRFATNELGNSKLDGTLALSDVDLTELVSLGFLDTLSTNIDRENFAVDLRLSAEQVSVGKLTIENVASTVSNGQDGFNLEISDSSLLGGMAVGKISIAKRNEQQFLSIMIDATDIDMQALEIFDIQSGLSLDATSKLHAELSTPLPAEGENFVYTGSLELLADSGQLNGLELPLRLDPGDERTMQVEKIAGNDGSTGFDAINFKVLVFDNSGFVQKSTLTAADYTLQMSGFVSFSTGSLALRGDQTAGSGEDLEQLQIGGTIFEPLITIRQIDASRTQGQQDSEATEN